MRRNGTYYFKIVSMICVGLIIVGYSIFNFRIFISGPEIIVTSPQNGAVVNSELVEINGKAVNTSFISLNDRSIFVDEDGNFKEFLLLSSGYNIIVIKAHDQFEREISKNIELVFEGDSVNHNDVIQVEAEIATSTTDSSTTTDEVTHSEE